MSSTSRFIARIGSAAVALAMAFALAAIARADAPIAAAYQGQTIRFTHLSSSNGTDAIGAADPGLAALLHALGASMTWKPGDRYVLITTSVPAVVSFSVGDRRYDIGTLELESSFAPYQIGEEVYIPFQELMHALDLDLRRDGNDAILQPQLASLDVRSAGNGRIALVAHAGAPLRPRVVSQSATSVTYEFAGVGTTLAGTRGIEAGGIHSVQISQSGGVRDPKTTLTLQLMPGAVVDPPRSTDDRNVVLGVSGPGAQAPAPVQAAAANPNAAPPQSGPATVTGVSVQPSDDGYNVTIAVSGNATFEWHRLRDPDNRFWIDIKGAQLQGPPIDQQAFAPVGSVRVRQTDAQTVRVALSLAGPQQLSISPSTTGVVVDVARDVVADAPRSGSGSVGTIVAASGQQAGYVTPAPIDESGTSSDTADASWKFGPRAPMYVPTNPRLIVIDPGHGGSDKGAIRNGVAEADLSLDMAKRLRDILVSRGWLVQMTHDTDVDVYGPDASAHDELQARVDVANNAGARMFVSIHVNSFINSGPYGTTVYCSKPGDVAFAKILSKQLANDGTKNDGIVKSHLYVTLHTLMPAALVETAFLSNPSDFSLLTSQAFRQKVVQAIADGIEQYNAKYPVQSGNAQ